MSAVEEARPKWVPGMARNFIGGSDTASLLGLAKGKWGSQWKLWAQLVGLYTEQVTEQRSAQFRRGHIAERFIAEMFHEETGRYVESTQLELTHPEWPFLVSHLDGLVTETNPNQVDRSDATALATFEAKVDSTTFEWDEVPIYYETQAVWNTGIARLNGIDIDRCMFGVFHNRLNLGVYTVEFDSDGFDLMVAKAVEFWHTNVIGGVEPDVDGSDATTEALAAVYGTTTDATVEISDDLYELWVELGEEAKAATTRFEEIRNRIRALIGSATYARCPSGHSFSWKPQTSRRVAGLDDLGDQMAHWLNEAGLINETTSRTLRHHKPTKPKNRKN